MLVLDRAFRGERRKAIAIAGGASLAEAAHAFAVGLTLPLLLSRWPAILVLARGAGAALLLVVGLLLAVKPALVSRSDVQGRGGNFVTGLAAAGLNPTLLVSWTAVISAFYGEGWLMRTSSAAAAFALGVGIGVVGWLVSVVFWANRLSGRMDARKRGRIVQGFGFFLMAVGGYIAVRLAMAPHGVEIQPGSAPKPVTLLTSQEQRYFVAAPVVDLSAPRAMRR